MEKIDKRYGIGPLRIRVVIPEFPEKAAGQASGPEGNEQSIVTSQVISKRRIIIQPDIYGFDNKIDGHPDEDEKIARIEH